MSDETTAEERNSRARWSLRLMVEMRATGSGIASCGCCETSRAWQPTSPSSVTIGFPRGIFPGL